jgi:hypothetical protein
MRYAKIECPAQYLAADFEYVITAEILPEAERNRRQIQPAFAAAAVRRYGITVGDGKV